MLSAQTGMAVSFNDRNRYDKYIGELTKLIEGYIYLNSDGDFPKRYINPFINPPLSYPPERIREYHEEEGWRLKNDPRYFKDDRSHYGILGDLGHSGMGLEPLMYTVKRAYIQGTFDAGRNQERLTKAFEILARSSTGGAALSYYGQPNKKPKYLYPKAYGEFLMIF